jgi:hypothetical protein
MPGWLSLFGTKRGRASQHRARRPHRTKSEAKVVTSENSNLSVRDSSKVDETKKDGDRKQGVPSSLGVRRQDENNQYRPAETPLTTRT